MRLKAAQSDIEEHLADMEEQLDAELYSSEYRRYWFGPSQVFDDIYYGDENVE